MSQKQISIALFIFGLAALAAVYGIVSGRFEVPTQTGKNETLVEPEGEELVTVPVYWQIYRIGSVGERELSIEVPEHNSVDALENNTVEIKYVGPESEEGTEITDGYYISLQIAGATSDEYLENDVELGEMTEAATTTFLGETVATYQTESALSSALVPHYVLPIDPGVPLLADISYRVYGEAAASYEEEVLEILETLSLSEN